MAVDDSAQVNSSDNRVFHGREAEVLIGDPLDSIGSDSRLDDQVTNTKDFSGVVTEITLTDPEATVEVQNTFGGQVMSESPHELVEIEFTARFQDTDFIQKMHGESQTVGTTDFERVNGGTTIGNRPNNSILFSVEKDGNRINYLMNNAIFQQMGEISLAGDDAAEITGTAVCRVDDRFVEKNF
jgi:hypothetical protein